MINEKGLEQLLHMLYVISCNLSMFIHSITPVPSLQG